jgi:hypothetical protein
MRNALLVAAIVAVLVEGTATYPVDAWFPPPPVITGYPGQFTVREVPHEFHGPEGGQPVQFPRGRTLVGISTGMFFDDDTYLGGY